MPYDIDWWLQNRRLWGLPPFSPFIACFSNTKPLVFYYFGYIPRELSFLKRKEKFTKYVYFIMASFDLPMITVLAIADKIRLFAISLIWIRHKHASDTCSTYATALFSIVAAILTTR